MSLRSTIKNSLLKHEALYTMAKKVMFLAGDFAALLISDRQYIKMQYRFRTGEALNLENPRTYNEKIQWLKLFYKKPILNTCVDKWDVRDFVRSKGLENILIPAYGPYESFEDINFDDLPNSFIIKLTNGSGLNIICSNKKEFNFEIAAKRFKAWQKINFFNIRREWAYKDVENRILCENLISDKDGNLPSDYRFFCFNGKPKIIAVDLDSVENGKKTSNYFRHLFTTEWCEIDGTIQYPRKKGLKVPKPKNLDLMIEMASILSSDFVAVRVDLYNDDGKIMFGELTFYHASGYQKFHPEKLAEDMGDWISLPPTSQ